MRASSGLAVSERTAHTHARSLKEICNCMCISDPRCANLTKQKHKAQGKKTDSEASKQVVAAEREGESRASAIAAAAKAKVEGR